MASEVDFVFSAVDRHQGGDQGHRGGLREDRDTGCFNNSAHRWTPDVPHGCAEINPEHMKVIDFQERTSRVPPEDLWR